ncbi:MAG TPA: hypothetical protein VKR32_07670, partial [Puia sp.]|nr:hypothetical protein [Puia sp.]
STFENVSRRLVRGGFLQMICTFGLVDRLVFQPAKKLHALETIEKYSPLTRKDFVRLSTFAAVAIAMPGLAGCHRSRTGENFSHPEFLSRLFDKEQVSEVGKKYLERNPDENDAGKLTGLLAGSGSIVGSKDDAAIRRYLAEAIANEFKMGNTVVVNGWILSHTEARQCALYSIVNE